MLADDSIPRGELEEHRKNLQVCEQRTLQHHVDTLYLQYMDTVLTMKRSVTHCTVVLSIHSALHFITEAQALSSVFVTFGTLFHQSLVCPARPLTQQQTCTSNSLSGKNRRDWIRCGKKVRSNKRHSRVVADDDEQQDDRIKSTRTHHFPSAATESHFYLGCRSRRHSITAPTLLPLAPVDRRLSRRYSIGLASPDKFSSAAFPATLMYAKIVSHLENNLESTRHYYHLQKFNNCFCGQSMVNCLQSYCVASLKTCITKEKATELCKRLLIHGVIENVSHKKQQEMEGIVFKCSRLYRFTGSHFWEEIISTASEIDGGITSKGMISLSSNRKMPRPSSIKKMCTTFTERKTGFVRSCRTRFSLKSRGSNTI